MPRPGDYWESIHSIAEDIRDDYPDPERHHNERVDRVHEDVDGSQWIIYTDNHEVVLKETHNTPDNRDVRSMSADDASWQDMRQIAAYLAMEADVNEELHRLDEEAEEAEEEEEETA